MVLVFDIGNTNITIGVFKKEELLFDLRLRTHIDYTADQYFAHIDTLLKQHQITKEDIEGGIIGSVVPPITGIFANMLKKYFDIEPVFVNVKTRLNVKNMYKNPAEVGDDRLANAAAGRKMFPKKDLVIIDFGTAITFDVVDKKGRYLGGVIMPGINVQLGSLHAKTAKLPQVDVKSPKSVIGATTESSIQSGIINSAIGAANHIIAGIKSEVRAKKVKVILTGGEVNRDIMAGLKERDIYVDRDFTLKGFRIIYSLNGKK